MRCVAGGSVVCVQLVCSWCAAVDWASSVRRRRLGWSVFRSEAWGGRGGVIIGARVVFVFLGVCGCVTVRFG